jgi:hypothetical protein
VASVGAVVFCGGICVISAAARTELDGGVPTLFTLREQSRNTPSFAVADRARFAPWVSVSLSLGGEVARRWV